MCYFSTMAFAKSNNVDNIEIEETTKEPWTREMKEYLRKALLEPNSFKKFGQKVLDFIQAELKRDGEEVKVYQPKKVLRINEVKLEITDGLTGFKYNNVDDFMESLGACCNISCKPCGVAAHSLGAFIEHLETKHWLSKEGYEEIVFERGAQMESESEAYYRRPQHQQKQIRNEIEPPKYPNSRYNDDAPLCADWMNKLKALRKKEDEV